MGYNNPIRDKFYKSNYQEELMAKSTKASYGSKSKSSTPMKGKSPMGSMPNKGKMMMSDKEMSAMKKKMGK